MSAPAKATTIRIEKPETSAISVCNAAEATPAMRQYFEVKSRHADCLVFYRMGDFYELFFDDAVTASQILDIALTKRGKHAGDDIKMCGVPVHAAEMYLQKLIASGHKIAICEQLETPEEAKKRGHKAVVRRDVVRIVTPGTITEETLLAASEAHYLAAYTPGALAWLDVSTGAFTSSPVDAAQLPAQLARLNPRELLLTQADYDAISPEPWFNEWRNACTLRPATQFDPRAAERRIASHFKVSGSAVYGEFTPPEIGACGALIDYVQLTQLEASARLDAPVRELPNALLHMDAATRRNLELTTTLSGKRHGSLLSTIDCTVSGPGARLLHQWLSAPLGDIAPITARHDAVEWLLEQASAREHWRNHLRNIADMERALGRLALGRGGPRDVLALALSLTQTNQLHEAMRALSLPVLLAQARDALVGHHALADQLVAALKTEVPQLTRDGNFIADGYRADLDEYRRLRDESRRVIAAMELKLKADTQISSLKIKHNNVLGYFIEITPIHEKKIPSDFIHRQGLAGALRYSTPELAETARRIDEAADKALKLELMLFDELVASIVRAGEAIVAAARALATLDVVSALAELAAREQWVRPRLTTAPQLNITQGRHPVVEGALRRQHAEFIANDCVMSEDVARLQLITGPNMGGKSTFLRQQAVLVILAQMGSYVPAVAATIGLVDKLFCRVGAADDLARGQSTFMVEMVETASILHQATERSLVVLDEIGRGTATYDGVSIAWAVAEHLHNVTQCRALFATHYHELTALSASLPLLANFHASAREYQGQLIFLHRIEPGPADKSYGIHVAALAGMPAAVLKRARALLTTLESGHSLTEKRDMPELPLFNAQPAQRAHPGDALIERLVSIDVDGLTPRQALEMLAELKEKATESHG